MDNTTKLSHYMELSLLKEALDCGILNSDSVLDMLMSSKKNKLKKYTLMPLHRLQKTEADGRLSIKVLMEREKISKHKRKRIC